MLSELFIQNMLLIERLELSFQRGLTVLTGETGAGKSILLGGLSLALGARAASGLANNLVRDESQKTVVTATFQLDEGAQEKDRAAREISKLLAENDLDTEDDGTLILKRSLSADGKSKAYINDQPVSVGLLRQVGARVLEIQGQRDQLGLLEETHHRFLLDQFAGLEDDVSEVRGAHATWQVAREKRQALESNLSDHEARVDYLQHIVSELETLDPQPDEEQGLAEKRNLLANVEKIREAVHMALAALEGASGEQGSQSCQSLLGQSQRVLVQAATHAPDQLQPISEALANADVHVSDAISELQRIGSSMDADPAELQRAEDRLFALRDAARKYGCAVEALPGFLAERQQELATMTDGAGNLDELRQAEQNARQSYEFAAQKLTHGRKAAAKSFDQAVMAELAPLKLEKAEFQTVVEQLPAERWGSDGQDKIFFQARTNPGMAFGPIARIASGGELSRMMLAVRVVLAGVNPVPSLVFDEVDSGIGGATADAVGERLQRLSEDLQVMVITHSPQVASRAISHFHVAKTEVNGKTMTDVTPLSDAARQEEIARMLSGATITDEARRAAQSLMAG